MQQPIQKVVIAGGGTAGWMSAALLKKVLGNAVQIELVESETIGIVGVGEATIPPIALFNQYLGLDEKAFLRDTHATIKLAIKFDNWRQVGSSYFHTFGAPGAALGFCNFQHYWLRAEAEGLTQRLAQQQATAASLWDFDLNYLCCQAGKFNIVKTSNPLYELPYAYHFDATLYGRFLRKIAEAAGVTRTEGVIQAVRRHGVSGDVEALLLDDGRLVHGDFFLDCSGLRSVLLQQSLAVPFESYAHYLPANRAVAVPSARFSQTLPYTRSIAHPAGWQWRIPLTHRNGNGLVYCSDYLSDDEACSILLANLDSEVLAEPRLLKFATGRTAVQWSHNVVAVGLASGFLEPLESTSIHLIQSAIVRLLKVFPSAGLVPAARDFYNAEAKAEFDTIRDFIILHYHANERTDSVFWRDMRQMQLPTRLTEKIALFRQTGQVFNDAHDIFRDASWLQVMLGQGIVPTQLHPAAALPSSDELTATLQRLAQAKREPLGQMLAHDEFLQRYCALPTAAVPLAAEAGR